MQMTEELGGSFADLVLPDDPDKIFELGNAVGSGFVVFRLSNAYVLLPEHFLAPKCAVEAHPTT